VKSIAYSEKSQLIYAGGKKGSISIIDIRQRCIMDTIQHAHNCCSFLTFDPLNHYLVSGGHDGIIKVWDQKGKKIVPIFEGDLYKEMSSPNMKLKINNILFHGNYMYTSVKSCGVFIRRWSYKTDEM